MRKSAWLAIALVSATACELQEVTIAQPDDIVVVEIVLNSSHRIQTAWLHRTRNTQPGADPAVRGAHIEIRGEDGRILRFAEVDELNCIMRRRDAGEIILGTCYASEDDSLFVQPGRSYQLTVRTADGRSLTGLTTVPGEFSIVEPAQPRLTIAPFTHYEVVWTQSANSWIYVTDASLSGLAAALGPGIRVPEDPLPLSGLSISRQDTTIVFPKEIGLFDRFVEDLIPVLVALQRGLPPGVDSSIMISAADRNYVNWIRGGGFNPSGQVRVPSVFGDGGTGVFGSVVQRSVMIRTRP